MRYVSKTVLSSYFLALAALEGGNVTDIPRAPASALLSAAAKGEASVFALFGGQDTNEVYFDELQSLYDIYCDDAVHLAIRIPSRCPNLHILRVEATLPWYLARPCLNFT